MTPAAWIKPDNAFSETLFLDSSWIHFITQRQSF